MPLCLTYHKDTFEWISYRTSQVFSKQQEKEFMQKQLSELYDWFLETMELFSIQIRDQPQQRGAFKCSSELKKSS
ncbi:hypothetical protein VNO77_03850 [Canavalia gladiata]|uniref:Uncharacterized protein n=1 Tax=Canavalia gladiata TaxID=3824 RepID=A0AAN9N0K9_CANGL